MSFNITPRAPAGGQLIGGYGDGGFTIAGARYQGSVLILSDRTLAWSISDAERIDDTALADLTKDSERVEIVIVGCGHTFQPVPIGLVQSMREKKIGLEWMDTGAACRTFNVLLTEGRQVAAALIAID